MNRSQLSEMSSPELTWLSERLPVRYQYDRRPSDNFDRADKIRFLLQLQRWKSSNRDRRVTFDRLTAAGNERDSNTATLVRENSPPRYPSSGRRNRQNDNNRRPLNRQRLNNGRRIYNPSEDPAQEILSLTSDELHRLARNDTVWLAGLCAALVAKYPSTRVDLNNRDPMSVLAAASSLQGKLDHMRMPFNCVAPNNGRNVVTGAAPSNILSNIRGNSQAGYPTAVNRPYVPNIASRDAYLTNDIAARTPMQSLATNSLYPALQRNSFPLNANVALATGGLGFQEGIENPQAQSSSNWNGLPLATPEEVGHYAGLGVARPQLLVRNRLGASILREFLLSGQNPEVYIRQRFSDLGTKDREPSVQAFAEAVSLARTIHFIIHMFGDVSTALRQCEALEISLRRLWVLLEVEQACFNGTKRKDAWRTFGSILEHTVHGQQSNSIVHQVMRRDFYQTEKFANAVRRTSSDPGGD